MVVLPCTMGSLAAIAGGYCGNLVHRCADVTLKERRPLLLAVRGERRLIAPISTTC